MRGKDEASNNVLLVCNKQNLCAAKPFASKALTACNKTLLIAH